MSSPYSDVNTHALVCLGGQVCVLRVLSRRLDEKTVYYFCVGFGDLQCHTEGFDQDQPLGYCTEKALSRSDGNED